MEGERTRSVQVILSREERQLVLEIGAAENRGLQEQLKEFIDEGIERRQRLMRAARLLVAV